MCNSWLIITTIIIIIITIVFIQCFAINIYYNFPCSWCVLLSVGVLNVSSSRSARAMGRALVAHSRIRRTVTSVTVVLPDTAMMKDFAHTLTIIAAAQDNLQTTSSATRDELKRLYISEAEGEERERFERNSIVLSQV